MPLAASKNRKKPKDGSQQNDESVIVHWRILIDWTTFCASAGFCAEPQKALSNPIPAHQHRQDDQNRSQEQERVHQNSQAHAK
jgi:hypothetical protein